MKSDLPWHLRGVRRQALEAAREAARRRNMSVGEWLDRVILTSAARPGSDPRQPAPRHPGDEAAGRDQSQSPRHSDPAPDRLRHDLLEIGLMLQEALPRRAIEALEREVRQLGDRLDNARHAGADTAALARVERAPADIRDELRTLVPAESLFNVARALQQLAQKIEHIDGRTQDPAELRQLEGMIAAMRAIVARVSSNDALAKLSHEVGHLAEKIDQAASRMGGKVVSTLDRRLTLLIDALEARNRGDQNARSRLEALVKALIDKIERGELTRTDQSATSRLAELTVKLSARLEASEARPDRLETLEHRLTKLHLDYQQALNLARTPAATPTPDLDALARDVAELRQAEKQTQESLEAMHGTLGHVIDRLAMIETDRRSKSAPAEAPATPAVVSHSPAAVETTPDAVMPEDAATLASAAPDADGPGPSEPRPAGQFDSIDAGPPSDARMEPASDATHGPHPASAADRSIGREAAPADSEPGRITDGGGKSDFIAAARRAAQAASRQAIANSDDSGATEAAPIPAKPARRIAKWSALIVAVAIVLAVLGTLQIARGLRNAGSDTKANEPEQITVRASPAPPAGGGQSGVPASSPSESDDDTTTASVPRPPNTSRP
jgi:localization factor PodJL